MDGLRAISILLVILGHLGGTQNYPNCLYFFGYYSNFGVRVFFVISGYLITKLLIEEKFKNGFISLKEFYFRRAVRILPAAYVFITIVALIFHNSTKLEILGGYFYFTNYITSHWQYGHLWSLANEEQFYFIWPLLCAFLFTRARKLAIIGILIGPIFRIGFYFSHARIGYWFPVTCDALATGCFLAFIWECLDKFRKIIISPKYIVISIGIVLGVPLLHLGPHSFRAIYNSVGLTLLHLAIACLIYAGVVCAPKWLNKPIMVWIGVLSYSLYLWQEIFLYRDSREWWTAFPQNLILTFGVAAASYYLVEKPALQFRGTLLRILHQSGKSKRADEEIPRKENGTTMAGLKDP